MYTQNLKEKREVEDLKKSLRQNFSGLSSQNEKSKLHEQKINAIQLQLNHLNEKIEDLGGGTGGENENLSEVAKTGKYHDLEDRPDEYFEMGASFRAKLNQVWGVSKKGERTKKFWFTCAVDSILEGTVTIVYKGSRRVTGMAEKMQFLINDVVVNEADVLLLNPANTTLTLSFKLRPKKSLNNFSINFTRNGVWSGDCIIANFEIDMPYGKNIFFLSRSFNWHATVYKDKYLFFKGTSPYNLYFEKSKDDFDFSTGEVAMGTDMGQSLVLSYVPNYSNDLQSLVNMNYSQILSIGLDSNNYHPRISIRNLSLGQIILTSEIVHAYSLTYFKSEGDDDSFPGVCVIIGDERKLAFWEPSISQNKETELKLNSVIVERGIWVDVSAVIKQDMDGTFAGEFRGCVATKFNGECVFFPSLDSSYFVSVGFGRRVNTFLQDNGNINIYLGRKNHVIKKVLVKNNETNQYEIDTSKQLRINGYDEIVETLDGCFIGLSDDLPELVEWSEI